SGHGCLCKARFTSRTGGFPSASRAPTVTLASQSGSLALSRMRFSAASLKLHVCLCPLSL
ncbi:hypothetical protein GOP47_0008632, partial [Adiantum capillus-veneris]